jgi:hypothetical protein
MDSADRNMTLNPPNCRGCGCNMKETRTQEELDCDCPCHPIEYPNEPYLDFANARVVKNKIKSAVREI